MGLNDLRGKLAGAFDEVKDKIPKGTAAAPAAPAPERDNSPAWAIALVDKLRQDPTVKLDAALAEAAKNIPNDGTMAGKAKAQTEAIEIINKEINIQIKSHPDDAEKLRAREKEMGGTAEPATPSVGEKLKKLGETGVGGFLKKKIHIP